MRKFLFIVLALFLLGCTSPSPTVTPTSNATIEPTPTVASCVEDGLFCGLGVACCTGECNPSSGKCEAVASPTPTITPTPVVTSSGITCSVDLEPDFIDNQGETVVVVSFNSMPSSPLIVKCSDGDSGKTVSISSTTLKGITSCSYAPTATTIYKVSAISDVSCSKTIAVNVVGLLISDIITNSSQGSMTISWNTNQLADSRILYGLNSTNLNNSMNLTQGVTYHFVTLTGLLANTNYYYKVISCTSTVCASTDVITHSTSQDGTPPVVTLTSPSDSAWVASSNVSFSFIPIDSALANCSLFVNTTWVPNATITSLSSNSINAIYSPMGAGVLAWNVQCFDQSGNKAFASSNNTAKIDYIAPTASTVSVANSSDSSIFLTWTASIDSLSGVSTYAVYRNATNIANTTNLFYENTGLTTATAYNFVIKTFDVAGNTVSSNSLDVSTS
ncbi:fibronectin type III domain-containing protein [Candidatus Micrarchaeota archaeon]|nr:fibronectin type III domain-containing protein [Candidatus Micrarchaeota archaeon]